MQFESSHQLFTVFDSMLDLAVTPLIQHTSIVEHFVSQLIVYQYQHKKRRMSIGKTHADAISCACDFLAHPTPETFRLISLDRGYTCRMLRHVEELLAGYDSVHQRVFHNNRWALLQGYQKLQEYHSRVLLNPDKADCVQLHSGLIYMNKELNKHRENILQKYFGYIGSRAFTDSRGSIIPIDIDDLKQNYYMAANKAVDHFSISRGTFKPYLDIWLKKARNSGSHFYGSAFSKPGQQEVRHLYVPLEEHHYEGHEVSGPEHIVNIIQQQQRVQDLIRAIDPEGYALQALQLGKYAIGD